MVVAQYVITAVPDPEATLDEFARVLKPGGEIVLVNHIGAETGLRRAFEQCVRAGGATARLAAGISLGPACELGGKRRRHAADRAPADAAARAFLADPLCQGRCRRCDCRRGAGRALILPVLLSAPILVAPVLLAPLQFAPLQLPLQRAPLQLAPIIPFVLLARPPDLLVHVPWRLLALEALLALIGGRLGEPPGLPERSR